MCIGTYFYSRDATPPRHVGGLKGHREPHGMRVYLDGCFDMLHYGHALALRAAKGLGTELVVGVVGDEFVSRYKAPPVLTGEERCALVESLRCVDEVVPGVPHVLGPDFTTALQRDLGVSLVVHGDDATLMPDGTDAYEAPKARGMFREIPRTPGISTTDVVRALLEGTVVPPSRLPLEVPRWDPRPDTVFVDGGFDCLHVGHVAFLKEARRFGDALLVGLHSDYVVEKRRGRPPVMCLADRARMLLECRYVDGVLLDTPDILHPLFLSSIGARRVARGVIHETTASDKDRYIDVAEHLTYVASPSLVTLGKLVLRVHLARDVYAAKVRGA